MTTALSFRDDRGTLHLFSSVESRDSYLDKHPLLKRFAKRVAADGEVVHVPTMVMDALPPLESGEQRMSFREPVQMVTDRRDDARRTLALTDAEIVAGRDREQAAYDASVASLNDWRGK